MSESELEVRLTPERSYDKISCSVTNAYHNLLTLEEVQTIVKNVTAVEADVQKFSLKPYSNGKLGFLGSHQRLCVEIKTASGIELLSFFVKVVPYEVPAQAEYVLEKCVFLKERIFYRDIVPQFHRVYKHEQWTATCYMVKENMLVFEDLSEKGYSLRDKLFNKELIVSGLTSLARLHASSLLAEAQLGKSLRKMYPYAFVESGFLETGKTRTWFNVSVNAIVAIAEHIGLDASSVREACEGIFPAIKMSSSNCLLVDFQLLRYSPLAHDVIQFLYLCSDRDFRVTWEETMLKHYYSVLCEILNSTKSVCVQVPPWSELIEGMEEQRLAAVITAAAYFQTVLLDEQISANIMNDPDAYHKFAFKNRNEIVINAMKTDPMYCKRLTETVTELVELSFRLDELPKPT